MDDPLLALLNRLCRMKLRSREKGGFSLPAGEGQEPMRTELALAQAFNCGLGFRRRIARYYFNRRMGHYAAHDRETATSNLERLQGFLGEGSPACAGIAYPVVLLVVQIALAINVGFLFAHPWAPTLEGQRLQLVVNLTLQLFCAVYSAAGYSNDYWSGYSVSLVYLLEGVSTAFIFASVVASEPSSLTYAESDAGLNVSAGSNATTGLNVTEAVHGALLNATDEGTSGNDDRLQSVQLALEFAHVAGVDEDRVASVAQALAYAEVAATLLQTAIYVPLGLMAYDILIVPVATRFWKNEKQSCLAIACELLVALLIAPFQVAKLYLGFDADFADVAKDYGDTLTEMAMTTAEDVGDAVTEQIMPK